MSRAQRYVLFIVLYIVFTVKENTNGFDKQPVDVISLFKVITKAESIARMFTKVGRTVFSSLVVVKGKLFTP